VAESLAAARAFWHAAFFYRTDAEYAGTVANFLRDGLADGEPVFAAVPPAKVSLLRDALGADARRAQFADMTLMGHNPAWIIPVVLAFTERHAGRHVRYVGEPMTPRGSTPRSSPMPSEPIRCWCQPATTGPIRGTPGRSSSRPAAACRCPRRPMMP
jgi:MEDS: MEthanogen/methylotroph, DcmR Sensory domain